VRLFNGRDGEWAARIEGFGKGWCSLAVTDRTRAQTQGPQRWLLFAPIKRARQDFLVEKATELGVTRLQPVLTARTEVRRVNAERLRATTREAAEQCERLDLPQIAEARDLDAVLAGLDGGIRVLLCAERADAPPVWQAAGSRPGGLAALVGPEGGFTPQELDRLRQLPFVVPVSLGPRILRAETAALAVLARVPIGPTGRRIAILGDMLELGDHGPALHAGLADDIAECGIDTVHTVGPLMAHLRAALPADRRGDHGTTAAALAPRLRLGAGDAVLVKGSLGMAMAQIVTALRAPQTLAAARA